MEEDKIQVTGLDKSVNVIIPVRDRDKKQIQRCVDYIKNNNLNLVDKIVVVDYSSKKPIKCKGCEVLRVDNQKEWCKTHALNLGMLKYPNKFLMSVDVDMLLSEEHFKEIKENLKENNLIINTNVRRISPFNLEKTYEEMVVCSFPWRQQDVNQFNNTANGGIQLYSKRFYDQIGGLNESMGIYSGAMDNLTVYLARMLNYNVVDLSYPLLHVEHKNKKEMNYSKEEREIASNYRIYKAKYLNTIIREGITKNKGIIGGLEPDKRLFNKFIWEYTHQQQIVQEAINKGKKEVEWCGQVFRLERARPKVLIAVINNSGLFPDFFVWDLIPLFNYTAAHFDVEIQQVNACDVNSMRNLAVQLSLGLNGKEYDYLVQLDDDHSYPMEFIVNFINKMKENNWPILTGLTPGKKKPYHNTQFYKLGDYNTSANTVSHKIKTGILDIEASGPVGMVINTNVFKNMKYPWYEMQFWKEKVIIDGKEGEQDYQRGGDLSFCHALKELNIPIKVDCSVNFPHCKSMFLYRGKVVDKTKKG